MEGLKVIDYGVPDFVPDAALIKYVNIEIVDADGDPVRNKRFKYSINGGEEKTDKTSEDGVLLAGSVETPEKVKLSFG